MNTIEYKGKEYPTRTFLVNSVEFDEPKELTIGTISLYNAFNDEHENHYTEANNVDCQIYYYVEDNLIGLSGKEICKHHLDIEMELIEEITE